MSEFDSSLFRRARESAEIESVAGTRLQKAGSRMRGECPLCGAGQGKGRNGHFSVDPVKQIFYCFGCQQGGDVIDLEHLLNSGADETRADAARRLLGEAPRAIPVQRPVRRPVIAAVPKDDAPGWTAQFARQIWGEAQAAEGTLVERYLTARGITGRPLRQALRHLRFHPMAYHSGSLRRPLAFPAMLARVFAPAGATGAVHATYLSHDGQGKAVIEGASSKVMWGPQSRAGAPGGAWLTHPRGKGPLIVAEGIETALSVACLIGEPCRVTAALSLDRLQGGWLADRNGLRDPDCPRPDPDRPAYTWPEPLEAMPPSSPDLEGAPAAPWGEVIIAVDHDMKPIQVRTRGSNRQAVMTPIDGHQRARICAALAKASWERTTSATVMPLVAEVGKDFNNMLREAKEHGQTA